MVTPIAPSISLTLIKFDLKRHGYYLVARQRRLKDPLEPMTSRREWTTAYEVYDRGTRKQVVKFSTKDKLQKWIDEDCPTPVHAE